MSADSSALVFWAPAVFALVTLFAAWIYYSSRNRWLDNPLQEGTLYRCATCGRVYVEPRQVPMARCPHCARMNEVPVR